MDENDKASNIQKQLALQRKTVITTTLQHILLKTRTTATGITQPLLQ